MPTNEEIMNRTSDNIIKFPGEAVADVEAAAAGWLARMTSGTLTLGQLAEFEYWRAASPDHDRIYGELERMWDRLGTGAAPRGLHHRLLARLRGPDGSAGWAMRLGQIAAAVLAVVMVSQYLINWRYDYHTAPGEIRQVALADGSTVYMKGGTALDTHVSKTGARTIVLARGEAFFDVVHDDSRPFTVMAGSGVIRDVGTGFSVARSGQSAMVAVEHGAVAVTAGGLSDTLAAGDQVSFNLYDLGRKQHIEKGMIAAWRRGQYVAQGKPLGTVLGDIDEYHPGRIIVTSNALAARRVNAVVQFDHIDAWLDALGETEGVSVRHWGPLTIIGDRPS